MKRMNDVLDSFGQFIDQHELEDFIARGWICPLRDETDYIFEDIDIARTHLICELHIEMKIEADTMNIILSLLDQLYERKSYLEQIIKAIETQPEDIRNAIIRNAKDPA